MSADIVIFPSIRVERYGDDTPAARDRWGYTGTKIPLGGGQVISVLGDPRLCGLVELRINGEIQNLTVKQARDLSQALVREALNAMGEP